MMVTYGDADVEKPLFRTVKTPFLVLPCKSVYQCIIGRPALGRLGAAASTVHLKMKFYFTTNEIVTLHADLESSQRCHYMSLKTEHKTERVKDSLKKSTTGNEVNVADLDD